MDFAPSAATQELCRTARRFVEERLYPLEPRLFAEGFTALQAEIAERRAEARALGLWVPQLPRASGGGGLALLDFGLLGRELGRSPLGHYACNCQAPDAGNMEILLEFGSDEQRRRFLAPLVAGEARSAFALTEPDLPGSNPTWLGTRARAAGEEFVLDGRKWFASSADGAAFTVVVAVTDPDEAPHRRASLFLVPAGTPGFRLVRNLPVMGHAGEGWASHAELEFADCRVPAANLLGPRGEGFRIVQARLGPGRIHHCMRWLGICERAFELLCRRAATRELAPGVLLGGKQRVQSWIARSRAEIDAATLLVLETAWRIDREGARAARAAISRIKFFVAGTLQRVLDRALQAHGALGVTDDTPLAWFYRHERAARIYDGPDEVHEGVVARDALRAYGLEV